MVNVGVRAKELVHSRGFDRATAEGRSHERYRRILLTTFTSVGARGIGVVVSLVTVPLTLTYLGKAEYGVWAIITSFTSWVALFDFGILNGLVHAVSEAYGKDDTGAAAGYVATAFWLLLAIAVSLALALMLFLSTVPWASVLGVGNAVPPRIVKLSVLAAALPVIVGVPLSIVRQVYAGYQKTYIGNAFIAIGSIGTLIGVIAAVRMRVSLPLLIFIYGAVAATASLLNLAYLIRREMPWLMPRFGLLSRSALRRLLVSSTPLFIFQIGALLVNNSQLLVLGHRASLAIVTDYSVLVKLYAVIASFIVLSTYSFVPSFREAFERGDIGWMKNSFRRMLSLRMVFAAIGALVLVLGGNSLLAVWLRRGDIHFSHSVWLGVGVLMIASTWQSAFGDLLTIMDKVWIQITFVVLNGVVTVGLTYVLVPKLGVLGALLAISTVTVLVLSWLMPLIARPIFSAATDARRGAHT